MGVNRFDLANMNNVLPKIIEKGRDELIAQAKFLRVMKEVQETMNINPLALSTPYVTEDNSTLFAVGEGGAILGGAPTEYEQVQVGLRAIWKSITFSGSTERVLNDKILEVTRNKPELMGNQSKIMNIAQNRAIKDLVYGSLKKFAHHENYFALNGGDKSAIGTVTAVNTGTNTADFAWATTPMGNRLFDKNQQVQFYNGAGTQYVGGLAQQGSGKYSTVVNHVDKTAANATNGRVFFDAVPSDLVANATAHFRNTYGQLPTGFKHYVDDSGYYKNILRSTAPEIFSSKIHRLTGSPTLNVLHLREMESFLEGKMGYDEPFAVEIWMNKCQTFNYAGQMYNGAAGGIYPVTQFANAGQRTQKFDPGVNPDGLYYNNKKIRKDSHIPPSEVFFPNFATWRQIIQTKLQPYKYDDGQTVISLINQYGERIDARQATIFAEYNWDCVSPRANGRIEGLAFDPKHVDQP